MMWENCFDDTILITWIVIFEASPVGFNTSINLIYLSLQVGSVSTDKKIHYIPANLTKLKTILCYITL